MNVKHIPSIGGVVFAALVAVIAGQERPADWPQWRGPNRDGEAASFAAPASWPERLTSKWKVEVGLGYATPLVVGNRIFMFSRQGDNEVMSALDPESGRVIWHTGYPAVFTMHSAAARHGPGPKSTPVFSSGKVFSIGMTGIVTAFDAATGRQVWQKPGSLVVPTYTTHEYRLSNSVIVGDALFGRTSRNSGQYFSVDARTGKTLWTSEARQAGNAAIVRAGDAVCSLQNDGQLVVFRSGPAAFEPVRRYTVAESETWTQPVFSGNRVFVKDVSTLALWTLN